MSSHLSRALSDTRTPDASWACVFLNILNNLVKLGDLLLVPNQHVTTYKVITDIKKEVVLNFSVFFVQTLRDYSNICESIEIIFVGQGYPSSILI